MRTRILAGPARWAELLGRKPFEIMFRLNLSSEMLSLQSKHAKLVFTKWLNRGCVLGPFLASGKRCVDHASDALFHLHGHFSLGSQALAADSVTVLERVRITRRRNEKPTTTSDDLKKAKKAVDLGGWSGGKGGRAPHLLPPHLDQAHAPSTWERTQVGGRLEDPY